MLKTLFFVGVLSFSVFAAPFQNLPDSLFIKKFFNDKNCDQIIDKKVLSICYNYNAKSANYVYYKLDGKKVNTVNIKERPRFYDEKEIPRKYRSTYSDYTKNQYDMDRGHLAPHGSFDYDQKSLETTYSMANIIPQYKNINRHTWIKVERLERFIAKKIGTLNVMNGVVYDSKGKTIGRNKVAVPKAFWKMVWNRDHNYMRCFYYENIIGLDTKDDKLRDHEVDCAKLVP